MDTTLLYSCAFQTQVSFQRCFGNNLLPQYTVTVGGGHLAILTSSALSEMKRGVTEQSLLKVHASCSFTCLQ